MTPSKYLEKAKAVRELKGKSYTLNGDFLLVERAKVEEVKTASGLILHTEFKQQRDGLFDNMPEFVRVLDVGAGYYDESGKDVPLDVQVGDIILVGRASVKWLSVLEVPNYEPFSIGITRETEIQLRFHGDEGYKAFMAALNDGR